MKESIRCVLSKEKQTGLILGWLEKRQLKGDMDKIHRVVNRDWLLVSLHMKIMGHHMGLQRVRFKGKCSSLTVQLTCIIPCCRNCFGCWKFTEVQKPLEQMNGRRLHQWLWNNRSQLCLWESIKYWRLGECLRQKPYKLVLFLFLLQKSTVGNYQGKDVGLHGPLVQIHPCILLSCRNLPAQASLPSAPAFPAPSALLGKSGNNCLSTSFILHHWDEAQFFVHIESTGRFLRFKYWKSDNMAVSFMVLSIGVCISWHFSLHIMESWNSLGYKNFKYHLVPIPCHGRRQLPLDQVAPSPIQLYWT